LTYRAKSTGEVAKHTILLNVKRNRCLRVDLENLKKKLPSLDGLQAEACQELIDSITETLETGGNRRYTKTGYYQKVGNGNVVEGKTGVVYVRGYAISKTVLIEGEYKKVNSRPKTIEKNKLRKELKSSRVREFRITGENFIFARNRGRTLEIHTVDPSRLKELQALPPIKMTPTVAA
jgi:hypothetical protein